ncbi:hypothetical protein [Psittacine adenovirus 2]|nr:hypothetical protein [Psittacine adenovirus 2]
MQQVSHIGNTVFNSFLRINTFQPRLCNVIASIDVITSSFKGSFVQHSFPDFLEQRGGRQSNFSFGGGKALILIIMGFMFSK